MNTNTSQLRNANTEPTSRSGSSFVSLRAHSWLGLLLIGGAMVGCRKSDMGEQPRYKPYQATVFFENGASERALVPGTVPRGDARTDELMYEGTINGKVADQFPFKITHADLIRGQQQFNIFCSPCHGQTGEGNGMIPTRGLTPPPSYHIDRLRSAPAGHFFEVITNGFGAMYSYAERVKPRDRWCIAAYIRALQLSQNAKPALLTADERQKADSADKVVPPSELEGYTGPRGKVGVDQ